MGKLRAIAIALGAPGLFLIAFLDASFLSLPEIADLLVVWMVTRHETRMPIYVFSATLGSLAGCLVMYFIGRKGGQALAHKRFTPESVERVLAVIRRHGVMAVVVPAILPPPMPFKIFVLLAGVAGIKATEFSLAVIVGRGVRYLALGLLAVEYGDRTMTFLAEHGLLVSVWLLGLVGAAGAGYLVWSKVQARKHR